MPEDLLPWPQLQKDLEWLESGGVEEDASVAAVAAPVPVAATISVPKRPDAVSPRSTKYVSPDSGGANRAISERMDGAKAAWSVDPDAPKKKFVVVWDFNNTLVPWYKMKRGGEASA